MSAPRGATTYTLTVGSTALTFMRPEGEFDRWFNQEPAYTKSKVLRGTSARTVIDVGADDWAALTIKAAFLSAANVTTARGFVGQAGTLANTRGFSAAVFVAKVGEAEESALYGLTLDLTFERLS